MNWQVMAGPVSTISEVMPIADTNTAPRGFYRVTIRTDDRA